MPRNPLIWSNIQKGGMANKKIFIVDDDVLLATMLADHLRTTFPHEVMEFHTGEKCLEHLGEHPDLVILDYHLNNTVKDAADGLRILEKIKKLDRHAHVIMLSSQTQYGVALQTVAKGAEHYVLKGKDQFDQIDRIVREMIG
jgi:CheY-like chemotaxis protein